MSHAGKRNDYKEKAKKAYAYWQKNGTWGSIENGWHWLLSKPERLTGISTLAIFVATAVAVGVGIAQWRALRSTDEAIHGQLATLQDQLKEMKSSGQQTDKLIIAVQSSANTAHDTLVKAQRPFVYQKGVFYGAIAAGEKKIWRAAVEWENSGLTPTKTANFELICVAIGPGSRNIADPYALKRAPHIASKIVRVSAILAPKQAKFGGQCEFLDDELVKAQNGISTQYLIAQVSYTDIFDIRHITRYCEWLYHIEGNVVGFGNILVSGNSCIRHNCADDECAKEDAEPNLLPEKLIPPK